MEESQFEFVCAGCLESRGVLESERLPERCANCDARDPWVGPFIRVSDPDVTDSGNVLYSPFYLAAVRPARRVASAR
jgi:hypothetical protein